MNRRNFFATLAAAALGPHFPEICRALRLAVPNAPYCALSVSEYTREALSALGRDLQFAKQVNRDYDNLFGVKGTKLGETLNVRRPARYRSQGDFDA